MARFNIGNYAEVIETGRKGMVTNQERTKVSVQFFDKSLVEPEIIAFKDHELKVTEADQIKTSELCPLVRAEITLAEISHGSNMLSDIPLVDSKSYRITAKDLYAGVLKMKKIKNTNEVYAWVSTVLQFSEDMEFEIEPWENIIDEVTESDVMNRVYEEMLSLSWYIEDSLPSEMQEDDFENIERMLSIWIDSNGTKYPEEIIRAVVDQFDDDTIDDESEKTQELFKNCLDYLCEKKDPKAIKKRGYCYYCGCKPYPNDWIKARDTFLEYYALTGDAQAANTLGYIYYYGRCNGGVPEYEEAFKYFSIGHAYTYFESTYKLADMFAHGYGVVQDGNTANHLYWSVYNQNYKRFTRGDYECKFADAALRIGNCYRDGIGEGTNVARAYSYYLQADLAIRLRVKEANHYGDSVVYNGIQKALSETREEYTNIYGKSKNKITFYYPYWAKWAAIKHRRAKIKIKELENGVLSLTVSTMKRYDEVEAPDMLLTIPDMDYCSLTNKITIKTSPGSSYGTITEKPEIIYDHFEYDEKNHKITFYLFEEISGELICDASYFKAPSKKKAKQTGEKYHFVSISFDGSKRTYDYLCDDESVTVGDIVIVNGYDGEKQVEVINVYDKYESELDLPIDRFKKIIRKA